VTDKSFIPAAARLENLSPYFLAPNPRLNEVFLYTFLLRLSLKSGRYVPRRRRGEIIPAAVHRRGSGCPGWVWREGVHLDPMRGAEVCIVWAIPVLII